MRDCCAKRPSVKRGKHAATQRRAQGHTLFELVMSLAICTVLLLAMQSTVMIASRAIPNGQTVPSLNVNGSEAMQMISRDLMYATAISEMTSTAVTFSVPDRNGDGQPETIRYAWSGNAGDPLTRQYNGGTAISVISSVQSFSLAYDKKSVAQPTTYSTSGETVLASNTGLGLLPASSAIQSQNWAGEYFLPTLPSNATSWAVTRVSINASLGTSSTGQALVEIRPVDATGYPTFTILDQQTLLGSGLTSSASTRTFTFTNATGLDPTLGAAIVVQWVSGTTACNIQYLTNVSLANASMLQTTNGGSVWSNPLLSNLIFTAYGTYTTPNPTSYNYYLIDVRATAKLTADSSTQLSATARVLNEPQVSGP